MKKIEAIIQPHRFEEVKEALREIGIEGMTVSAVHGHGHQKGHVENYRGNEYQNNLLPKIKLEIVVPSDRMEEVVDRVMRAARTGSIGDGKIFVSEVVDAIRIRKYDRGEAAL